MKSHFVYTLVESSFGNTMSKLSDYSKFDHLDDSDEEEGQSSQAAQKDGVVVAPVVATTRKDPTTGRFVFEFGGNTIYEWEQSLEGKVKKQQSLFLPTMTLMLLTYSCSLL